MNSTWLFVLNVTPKRSIDGLFYMRKACKLIKLLRPLLLFSSISLKRSTYRTGVTSKGIIAQFIHITN